MRPQWQLCFRHSEPLREYKFIVAESLRYSIEDGIRQGMSEVHHVVRHEMAQVAEHRRQKQRIVPEDQRREADEQILPGVEEYKEIPPFAFDKRVEQVERVVRVD